MNTTAFGSYLRQIREEKCISLRELAKKIGVSGAFLSDIELGRRLPSADKIELLAKEIGVPVEDLQKYDFRDEAEAIRQMMFADPNAGLAFRMMKNAIQRGVSPDEIRRNIEKDTQ